MPDEHDRTPVDLREDGLLWLINRTTFHPRGFALALEPDGSFSLLGDGGEPWRFADGMEDDLFRAAELCFAHARGDLDLEARVRAGEQLAAAMADHFSHAEAEHTPWALEALAAYREGVES